MQKISAKTSFLQYIRTLNTECRAISGKYKKNEFERIVKCRYISKIYIIINLLYNRLAQIEHKYIYNIWKFKRFKPYTSIKSNV